MGLKTRVSFLFIVSLSVECKEIFMKLFFQLLIWGVLGVTVFGLSACQKEDQGELQPKVAVDTADRTVLIYMAADNSLSSDGYENIRAVLKGMKGVNGRLLIYFDPANNVPFLMEVKGKENPVLDTLAIYQEEDSASPEVLSRIVSEIRHSFPAESYGLILWSHGMSWLPEGYAFPGSVALTAKKNMPRTKYFGQDWHTGNGNQDTFMELGELASALPKDFYFILFDACFMASVEVAYEFRDKCEYLIASPAEVIADGFPYEKIMRYLWGGEDELKQVCQEFYDYYHTMTEESWRSATVSMVKMSAFPAVVRVTREILQELEMPVRNEIGSQVWVYPLSSSLLPSVFYDFREYIRTVGTSEQIQAFEECLDRMVVYKKATANLFEEEIPADRYSGLTSYIPLHKWSRMNAEYAGLAWYKAVYE